MARSTPTSADASRTIFTVGHSNLTLEAFLDKVRPHGIRGIADVRRFAGSRRLPYFNAESLAVALPTHGLDYLPCPPLGGRRKPTADSPNTAWRNASFRAYADHMQTPEFLDGLERLMAEASKGPLAMMCAEAVPWRCHRSLIADALIVRGWTVLDVMSPTKANLYKLTPFASVDGTKITYPARASEA